VQGPQPLEPDRLVDLGDELAERGAVADVVAGGVEMAGVEADPEPGMAVERIEQLRELGDRAADRASGAGGVLHQQPGVGARGLEDALQGGRDAPEPGLEPRAEWEPTWKMTASASIACAASIVARSAVTERS